MKKYLADYYENTRSQYQTYHNHKEICAWGGLVLYVLFCGFVVKAEVPSNLQLLASALITVLVFVAAWFVFRYVQNQLAMKDRGGALAAAAAFLLAEILRTDDSKLKADDYLVIVESSDTKATTQHTLPRRLLEKADILNTRARGFQDQTKRMIYTLLALSTVSFIGLKWIAFMG